MYARNCASCRDQFSPRIRTRESLATLSPARILRSLDIGLMMTIASPMRRDEREAVTTFII
jgi:hypothetical protein